MQPHITLLAQGADAAAVQRTLAGLSGVRLAVCGAAAEVAGMLQGKAALYPSARKALACRAHGWTLLVQAGTQLSPDLWSVLERETAAYPDAAALDCRTLPLESGKLYHPVTLQTAWPDGRAVFLDRAAVQKVGGFANWPVQAALADLGLRLTLHGFGVYYCPHAAVRWDLPADPLADYCTAVTGSFLLACRYSGLGGIVRAKFHMLGQLLHPRPFPHVRPALLRAVGRAVGPAWAALGRGGGPTPPRPTLPRGGAAGDRAGARRHRRRTAVLYGAALPQPGHRRFQLPRRVRVRQRPADGPGGADPAEHHRTVFQMTNGGHVCPAKL